MLGFGIGRWFVGPLWSLLRPGGLTTASQIGWSMALVFALTYAALAGFSLPTRRALIMLAVVGVATLRRVRIASSDSLAAALIVVLAMAPLSVIHAGTWLSFGAVAVLLTLALRPAGHPLAAQAVIFAGLLPVLATFIGRVSLAGPLANAVCVPLFSLVVVPLTLLAVALSWLAPAVAMGLFALLDLVLGRAWSWLEALAAVPLAAWTLPAADSWRVMLALGAVCLGLTAARSVRARVVVIAACLPLALARAERPAHGDFAIDVYDVGQALAVAIFTRRHVLLYDAGARWRSTDAGAVVVVPQLRAAGVRDLAGVIVSHADMDHRGGLPSLLASYAAPRILAGEALPGSLNTSHNVSRCRVGRRWIHDGVRFSFVHPPPGARWEGNDASCVLRIDGRAGSALLTGDIEALAELSMVHGARVRPVDVVVGQHHGSASSSTAAFIAATAARIVVFSTGFDNRWSLPAEAVVGRWRGAGAEVFHTARDGGVRVQVGGHAVSHRVTTARVARPAWWRG
jgi:competence protein ComEC